MRFNIISHVKKFRCTSFFLSFLFSPSDFTQRFSCQRSRRSYVFIPFIKAKGTFFLITEKSEAFQSVNDHKGSLNLYKLQPLKILPSISSICSNSSSPELYSFFLPLQSIFITGSLHSASYKTSPSTLWRVVSRKY